MVRLQVENAQLVAQTNAAKGEATAAARELQDTRAALRQARDELAAAKAAAQAANSNAAQAANECLSMQTSMAQLRSQVTELKVTRTHLTTALEEKQQLLVQLQEDVHNVRWVWCFHACLAVG